VSEDFFVSGSPAAAPVPAQTGDPTAGTPVARRLFARRVAVKLISVIRESGAKTVIVTSPERGAGKSFLTRLVTPELEHLAPGEFAVVQHQSLGGLDPERRSRDRVMIIDGPAMLDGPGFLNLPDDWVAVFDASVLVVMARQTDREQLEECVQWLHASNAPPIGIVYNELKCPAPATRLKRFAQWVRGPVKDRFDALRPSGEGS
jgi:Mrp family chromosome partitioning ATPase